MNNLEGLNQNETMQIALLAAINRFIDFCIEKGLTLEQAQAKAQTAEGQDKIAELTAKSLFSI